MEYLHLQIPIQVFQCDNEGVTSEEKVDVGQHSLAKPSHINPLDKLSPPIRPAPELQGFNHTPPNPRC